MASPFEIKESIDKIIYRIYNITSDLFFFTNISLRRFLSRNMVYSDLHNGERCFILGTGPSLRNLSSKQLCRIASDKTFAVNFLYKSDFMYGFIPDYYLLMDNLFWGNYIDVFFEVKKKYSGLKTKIITSYKALDFVGYDSNLIFLYSKNYPVERIRFDMTSNASITMNVVGTAVLCAIFMGFKEIYLLGCDYNSFCSSGVSKKPAHCYDEHSEASSNRPNLAYFLKYYHLTTEFHYLLSQLAFSKNVLIRNLTPNSLLDAYEVSDLDQVLDL